MRQLADDVTVFGGAGGEWTATAWKVYAEFEMLAVRAYSGTET
jgi:hypothetical protein